MTAGAMPALPGFTAVEHLGSGGYADVYLYEQHTPRRRVAVKLLREQGLSAKLVDQFMSEANAMAELAHPHIVPVYSTGQAPDGRPYIAMMYYPPPSLAERAAHERFGVSEVLRIGIQIGSAIETAHRADILHRDIKPANILVSPYGQPGLTDFGIAARIAEADDDDQGLSVPWSPPEVVFGTAAARPSSDVYSLAATLWHLLVGRSPFENPGGSGNSQWDLMQRIRDLPAPSTGLHIPGSLDRLLRQTMAKDPGQRPRRAMDFVMALQAIEQEERLPRTEAVVLDERATSAASGPRGASGPSGPSRPVGPSGANGPAATSWPGGSAGRGASAAQRSGPGATGAESTRLRSPMRVSPTTAAPDAASSAHADETRRRLAPVSPDAPGPAGGPVPPSGLSPTSASDPSERWGASPAARPPAEAATQRRGATGQGLGSPQRAEARRPEAPTMRRHTVSDPAEPLDSADDAPRPRYGVIALAVGLLVVAVVAGVLLAKTGRGQAQVVVTTPAVTQNPALPGDSIPPGPVTVTAKRSGTTVTFSWTYSAALTSDTFLWRTPDGRAVGKADKATYVTEVPSGTQLCLEVKVVRADGSNAAPTWSAPGCSS